MDMVSLIKERDRFARLCGLEVVSAGDGAAVVRMVVRDEHRNAMDMVHGGALFTLADYAFALACNSRHIPAVGLSTSMNFIRPGRSGAIEATARELSLTSKVGTYAVEIRDEAGELLATCQCLAFRKADHKG